MCVYFQKKLKNYLKLAYWSTIISLWWASLWSFSRSMCCTFKIISNVRAALYCSGILPNMSMYLTSSSNDICSSSNVYLWQHILKDFLENQFHLDIKKGKKGYLKTDNNSNLLYFSWIGISG